MRRSQAQAAIWAETQKDPDAEANLAEAIMVDTLCIREMTAITRIPSALACLNEIFQALDVGDTTGACVAEWKLHRVPGVSALLAEPKLRLVYRLRADVAVVAKHRDHAQVMGELAQFLMQLESTGPTVALSSALSVEASIRGAHLVVDAVEQLARAGALVAAALFPHSWMRTHDDVRREAAACMRRAHEQCEDALRAAAKGGKPSAQRRRDAFRELQREAAAALDRGEDPWTAGRCKAVDVLEPPPPYTPGPRKSWHKIRRVWQRFVP